MRNSSFHVNGVSRGNRLKALLYGAVYYYSSYPRLIIETFLRSGFGERYYNLASLLTAAFVLFIIPLKFIFGGMGRGGDFMNFLKGYGTWYIFLFLFVWMGLKHVRAISADKKTFEYGRLSTFAGYINPFFGSMKIGTKKATIRQIECLLEPAGFFIGGIFLWLCGQGIGLVFIVCSIIYSISYFAEYEAGTQLILDYIDEMIYRKNIEKAFVEDKSIYETMGVEFRGEKPSNKVTRQEVVNKMLKADEPVDAK